MAAVAKEAELLCASGRIYLCVRADEGYFNFQDKKYLTTIILVYIHKLILSDITVFVFMILLTFLTIFT